MKRFCFPTIGAFALLAACTTPQKKKDLDFQVYFKPHMLYKQTVNNQMHLVMTYSGSDKILQVLKVKGLSNPMIKDTVENRSSITRTGKMDDDKKFPLVMEVDNSVIPSRYRTSQGQLYVYGSCEEGKSPSIDSVASSDIPKDLKDLICHSIQSTFAQIILPKQSLNVGDTFSIYQPLSMPVGSSKIDIKMKITYTLTRLSQDSAWFNTKEQYVFNMNVADVPIKASGGGKGTYTYDVANNFYSNYQTIDTINFDYIYPTFTMKMNVVLHGSFKENISPDK